MIIPERLSSLPMAKSLKFQNCSPSNREHKYPDLCLIFRQLSFFPYYLFFTWPVSSPTLSHSLFILPYCLVDMISKSSIALLILTLTSSVNAAAIAPRQFLLGIAVREGHY